MSWDISLKAGTASGTLLSMLPNLLSGDIARTMLLAVVGAATSFAITFLLKWFTDKKK